MPSFSFSELVAYLIAAPLGLYALFRWRYVQMVQQTIHETTDGTTE